MGSHVSKLNEIDIGSDLSLVTTLSHIFTDLHSALLYTTDPDWSLATRSLGHNFFYIVIKGELNVNIGTQQISCGPDSLICFPADIPHSASYNGKCRECELLAIHVSIVDESGVPLLKNLSKMTLTIPHRIKEFRYLVALANRDLKAANAMAQSLFSSVLIEAALEGVSLTHSAQELDPRIYRALGTIHRSFATNITIDELAKAAKLGGVQFRKLFRRDLGITPKSYLMRHRLHHASQLLCTQNSTIKEVAYRCGFNDEHYFHLSFKKHFGLTPKQYRSKLQS